MLSILALCAQPGIIYIAILAIYCYFLIDINAVVVRKMTRKTQDIDKVIGRNIQELRSRRNMSQKDVAESLGITFQQIQKYESGKNRISCSRLYHLSRVLQAPYECFFTGHSHKIEAGNEDRIAVRQYNTDAKTHAFFDKFLRTSDATARDKIMRIFEILAT